MTRIFSDARYPFLAFPGPAHQMEFLLSGITFWHWARNVWIYTLAFSLPGIPDLKTLDILHGVLLLRDARQQPLDIHSGVLLSVTHYSAFFCFYYNPFSQTGCGVKGSFSRCDVLERSWQYKGSLGGEIGKILRPVYMLLLRSCTAKVEFIKI
jgi:hypothetical protein